MDEDLKEMDMNDLIASITDEEANVEDLTQERVEETEESIDNDFLDNQGLSQN